MTNYFDKSKIGSSFLAESIVNDEPLLQICFDRIDIEVKPTISMGIGRMFEDFVEEEFSSRPVFSDKYFKAGLKTFPSTDTKKTGLKDILQMFEDEHEKKGENGEVYNTLHQDIEEGYVYTKPDKDGKTKLHGGQINRHRCLDQIRAHDYRFPIPEPIWEKLQRMIARFKAWPLRIGTQTRSLWEWRTSRLIGFDFQVPYFWEHENEGWPATPCRAKYDIIMSYEMRGNTYAFPIDIKATGDEIGGVKSFKVFNQNWRRKYIWQAKHYIKGFMRYCEENGIIPAIRKYEDHYGEEFSGVQMPYIIQESEDPFITRGRTLGVFELEQMTDNYNAVMLAAGQWIDAGRPVTGYVEEQIVDKYGRVL